MVVVKRFSVTVVSVPEAVEHIVTMARLDAGVASKLSELLVASLSFTKRKNHIRGNAVGLMFEYR